MNCPRCKVDIPDDEHYISLDARVYRRSGSGWIGPLKNLLDLNNLCLECGVKIVNFLLSGKEIPTTGT